MPPAKPPTPQAEARAALIQTLLIALLVIAILYLGFNLGVGILGLVLWIGAKAFGTA